MQNTVTILPRGKDVQYETPALRSSGGQNHLLRPNPVQRTPAMFATNDIVPERSPSSLIRMATPDKVRI
ncbi:hypothetical protein BDV27DRAFT_125969 [Aspergillus caelatus]|uniref:Uncharacterized protein n=1 Tax=Aspergillus caelatus TaxID=61420 RepID=A0A5N7AA76_9EURO|nr:uncharacterized protein BDV27DRAFT_125969 [Aspergillus caelatus]KAE8365979.1 hypothetical protein BDV27DRAFT_125969 [Aspergillus caelatus]